MKKLAKSFIEERKQKALTMIGQKMEMQITHKALSLDKEKFTATFVMSTESIDRHGDIIDQASWILDYFKQAPMFFLQHNSDQFPIGKWVEIGFEDDPDIVGKKRMIGKAEFRVKYEDAARAFDHVVEGDMSMVSVGFIPHRVDYDEARDAFILFDCELLECSLVGVGSNRQALVKEVAADDAREKIIEAKNVLDKQIKASENNIIISHLKARENLNKAIRRMRVMI